MELKSKTKFLLVIGIIFISFLLFNANKVQGYSYGIVEQGNLDSKSLDKLSSTINLDIKEIEFEKAEQSILDEIIATLKKEDVTIKNVSDTNWLEDLQDNETVTVVKIELDVLDIRKAIIFLETYGQNNSEIAKKEIDITYSNTSNYNEKDKKYVEKLMNNINLPKDEKHYIIEKIVELGEDPGLRENYTINELNKKINDASISFIANGLGSGDGNIFYEGGLVGLNVFKNGVYYTNISPKSYHINKITIPNSIEDTEEAYINYALPKIKKYLASCEYVSSNSEINIKKLSGYYYNVSVDDQEEDIIIEDNIIIKKSDGAYIGNNIYVNNLAQSVTIDVTEKENTTMEQELKDKGYTNILGSYELELTGAETLANPIEITFNVGTEHNDKILYILHKKKDGSYENFEKKVINGKVTITVSELSPFVLAVKEESTQVQPEETQKVENDTNKGEKDETPKTGTIDIISYVLGATLLSGVGIVVLKKKIN